MEAAAVIPDKIRVLIADDHRLFADALEAILTTDGRFEVVGKAHDGEEAVRLAGKTKPDVVLMDIAMPRVDGVEATRRIRKRRKSTAVLMLTGSNARHDVDRARQAGAAGYVTKDRIASHLVEEIVQLAG
jgi:DNA-binding NarL/FixJ family response regulator